MIFKLKVQPRARDGTRIDYYWGAQARDQPP